MSATMAPNVSSVSVRGRHTVYGKCGMCAVRCPIEVTVEDGKVTWLQGNPHDAAIGTSLCAKGAAGLSLEFDDDRPQTPLIRGGERGSGQWRRVSWDEALDYIAEKLQETIDTFGRRGIALSDRGGPFNDLTKTFVHALGSPNYFDHDAACGGNVHNAARSIYGVGIASLIPDYSHMKHLVLYGRNIVESLMVKEAKAFMAAVANGMRCTYIDPRATITAGKATRFWQVRPQSDTRSSSRGCTTRTSLTATSPAWIACGKLSRTRPRNGRSRTPGFQPTSCASSSRRSLRTRRTWSFIPAGCRRGTSNRST